MLISRPPPAIAELVDRAIAHTPFIAEITAIKPHDLRICAELAAELAAEHWERENDMIPGAAVGPELVADVADALVAHGQTVRDASDNALYHGHAKLERSIAALGALRRSVAGTLPLAHAESLMDDIEDDMAAVGVKLTRALGVFEIEIARIELAAEPV
jgi:hypothetical protein